MLLWSSRRRRVTVGTRDRSRTALSSSTPGRRVRQAALASSHEGGDRVVLLVLKTVVLGPILRLLFRPWVEGAENIPDDGAAILASNHLSFSDSIFLPLVRAATDDLPGQVRLLHRPGRQGPADRRVLPAASGSCPSTAPAAGRARPPCAPACGCCGRGELLGIYPEGTRSPGRPALPRQDRRRPDGARGAASRCCPVAMIGTDKAQPTGQQIPKIMRIGIKIGEPLDFSPLRGHGGRPVRPALDHRRDHVRAHAAVRPGVRRHLRGQGEGRPAAAGRTTASVPSEVDVTDADDQALRADQPAA